MYGIHVLCVRMHTKVPCAYVCTPCMLYGIHVMCVCMHTYETYAYLCKTFIRIHTFAYVYIRIRMHTYSYCIRMHTYAYLCTISACVHDCIGPWHQHIHYQDICYTKRRNKKEDRSRELVEAQAFTPVANH